MLKRLFNSSEQPAYERLKSICDENGAQVFSKIRLADVLPIENSGISNQAYSFALKSHFDFVVAGSDLIPRFAVEFDGPMHRQSDQKERDKLKDDLCKRFDLPLLRITSAYLDKQFRGLDLLTYFVELWFVQEWIDDAYKTGALPPDADVDPALIVTPRDGKTKFPYWLSLDHRIALQKLYEDGRILARCESSRVSIDQNENYRCVSYLEVQQDRYVIAETGMKSQRFPVIQSDLISDIALSDLFTKLKEALADPSLLESGYALDEILESHRSNFRFIGGHFVGRTVGIDRH